MAVLLTRSHSREDLSGSLIDDRYRAHEVAGRGGLGTVYRATDERLGRQVAVKVLLPQFSSNPDFRAMLKKEAHTTARIEHPSIVRIYDRGETPDIVYLVTEYIAGRSLRQVMLVKRPIPLDYCVLIIRRVAEALDYAHSLGVIHLDVKPSNVLMGHDGRVLLSDFGLALAAGESGGGRAGTPAYMSPEQRAGRQLDLRSDIYSLGVTLYELMNGRQPWANDGTEYKPRRNPGLRRILRPMGSEIPEKLAWLVTTALEEEPAARFPSAKAFLADLAAAVQIGDREITPRAILESCAVAGPEDSTGVFESERLDLDERVYESYEMAVAAESEAAVSELPPAPLVACVEARQPFDGDLDIPASLRRGQLERAREITRLPLPPARVTALSVEGPDGNTSIVPLTGTRLTVGRSSACELCRPEDAGLSRQHFAFECDGDVWTVQDLGSKNGTLLNNAQLRTRTVLEVGDRVVAGHLVITCTGDGAPQPHDVVVFGNDDREVTNTEIVMAESLPLLRTTEASTASTATQALIRAGQELTANRPLAELFPVILDLAIEAVNAQRGVVMLLVGSDLVVSAQKGDGFRISEAVRDRVLQQRVSILVKDAQLDDAFRGQDSVIEQRVHSMMAVPLQTRENVIGLIYVDSPSNLRQFAKVDLGLLTVMANIAANRIETARLAEIEQAERVMKRDLAQAAEIQTRMLPARPPQIPGLDLAGFNAPCRAVGGDYYEFFPYEDGTVGLALGNVSGKGMPAALMMTALQARVQVLAEDSGHLEALMMRLNKATCANCPGNRFITFFFGMLDSRTGDLRWANAGHQSPILVRASGSAEYLEGGGCVLGILTMAQYQEMTARLDKGDLLVIYTDGVTEANNPNYVEFGEDNLIRVLQEHRNKAAEEIVQAVLQALNEFSAGAPQGDDITLLVARRMA